MKQYTGKTNTGKAYRGIYTTSGMPNQKQKRTQKSCSMETSTGNLRVKCNINMFGIFGAIVTVMASPLTVEWKIGMTTLFLLSAVHVEVVENDK